MRRVVGYEGRRPIYVDVGPGDGTHMDAPAEHIGGSMIVGISEAEKHRQQQDALRRREAERRGR